MIQMLHYHEDTRTVGLIRQHSFRGETPASPSWGAISLRACLRFYRAATLCALQRRPAGDQEYCSRMAGRSPQETRWEFEDDTV